MSVNVYKGSSEGLINVGGSSSDAFVGTQQEWNDLPAADKAKYDGKEVIITDDYVQNEKLDIYSTDEIVVGRWIDGKPIYRKCGVIQSIPAGTESVLDNTLTTSLVDVVVQTGGCITHPTQNVKLFIGGYSGASYRASLTIRNNGLIFLSSGDSYKNINWWIEYTKTTDV